MESFSRRKVNNSQELNWIIIAWYISLSKKKIIESLQNNIRKEKTFDMSL